MITTFYPPYNFGGDGLFVQRLSHALARRGHQVEVIHCLDAYRLLSRRDPPAAPPEPAGIEVHRLHSRLAAFSPLATQQTGRPCFKAAAIRRVLARGFDVINYHNISLVGGPGVLSLGEGLKLYTLHDYWLVCPTHVLFKNRRTACREPACLPCQLAYRRPPQLWRATGYLQRCLRQVSRFITASRFAAEQHARMGLQLPWAQLPHFVPDRFPAREARPATAAALPRSLPEDFFLFAGRLEWLKGLQTLLPVFARRSDLQLVVAGTGAAERRLRRMARGLTNVTFLGRQEPRALQRLYQGAIALLVPSLCYEIHPLVILEALNEGTPVIARAIGSLPEMLQEGGGLTYTSSAECERALDRLRADREYRATLGAGARRQSQRRHSEETYIQAYLELVAKERTARASAAGPAAKATHGV